MNDPNLFPSDRAADLSRLNESETRVLRLLGEGHTAKTIATELGTTPAAVNERLREARRKTGVGSSRELARLLKTQESRDEQIGVAPMRHPVAVVPPSDAEPWRPQTGVFAMIALFLVAAAGAAALMTDQPAGNISDPLVGTIAGSQDSPDRLYALVRSEPRDGAWAHPTEQFLRDRYSKIPHVGGAKNAFRVICASTLCEVAGAIDAPSEPGHEYDAGYPLNVAMGQLQGKELHDDLAKAGLDFKSGMFGGGPDRARTTFLEYWSRKVAQPK